MRNRWNLKIVLVLLLLLLVAAGCGSQEPAATGSQDESDPLVITSENLAGDEELAEGVLEIAECAVLATADFGRLLLLWPPEVASWNPDQREVEFTQPDEAVVALQDGATLGVGGSLVDDLSSISLATTISPDCEYTAAWAVTSFI